MHPKQAALLLSLLLAGCAGYRNVKGKTEIALDQPDEGVQSLGAAAKKAPRNPEYQMTEQRGQIYFLKASSETRSSQA